MSDRLQIRRGMILAAGLGTRLRPLTLTTPKPLIPLDSKRLIDYPLNYLLRNKIEEIVINVHHLAEMIMDYVGDGSRYGVKIHYSMEQKILGTGGGIKKAEKFFKGEPFVCINSDSLIHADFGALVERYEQSNAAAVMVLKKMGADDPYEGIDIDNHGLVKSIGGRGGYFYTGLQIIGPQLLEALPPAGTVSCLVRDGYQKLLEDNKTIAAVLYDGYFNDLGTPERYQKAKEDIARIQLF